MQWINNDARSFAHPRHPQEPTRASSAAQGQLFRKFHQGFNKYSKVRSPLWFCIVFLEFYARFNFILWSIPFLELKTGDSDQASVLKYSWMRTPWTLRAHPANLWRSDLVIMCLAMNRSIWSSEVCQFPSRGKRKKQPVTRFLPYQSWIRSYDILWCTLEPHAYFAFWDTKHQRSSALCRTRLIRS